MPCAVSVAVIDSVSLNGNDITKNQVLLAELTFKVGDSIATSDLEQVLEQNRKRISNLRLFHEVSYTYTCTEGRVAVVYTMQERWYLYPIPILELADRNFNAWLEKKDYSRIDYGINLVRRNFRGRNEEVRVRLQQGFNKRLELGYRVPYISRTHKVGIDLGVADYRSRTINYTVRNNKQRFFEQQNGLPIHRTSFSGAVIRRQSVERQEGLRLSYHQEKISDSVAYLNPDYYRDNIEQRQYLRAELFKAINLRNNFAYPLTGSYFEAAVSHTLFLNQTGSAFTALRAKYVNYSKLSEKFYYTVGAEGQLRLAKRHAFADNIALGYRALVRGYELYVVGGQHYALFKQGVSYELLKLESMRVKQIKNPKFNRIPIAIYMNAFTDAAYAADKVYNQENPLANRLLAGGGFGLHFVTFYDIVLRLEYTLNREGDRGFYLNGRFPF
nr:POTRA domain-containing protein [Pontibacter vulgaris]